MAYTNTFTRPDAAARKRRNDDDCGCAPGEGVVSGPDADRLGALDADGASMLDDHFNASPDHALLSDARFQQQAARVAQDVLQAQSPRELAARLMRGVDAMEQFAGDDPRLAPQLEKMRALAVSGDPHAIVNAMTTVLDHSAHYMRRLQQRRTTPSVYPAPAPRA